MGPHLQQGLDGCQHMTAELWILTDTRLKAIGTAYDTAYDTQRYRRTLSTRYLHGYTVIRTDTQLKDTAVICGDTCADTYVLLVMILTGY